MGYKLFIFLLIPLLLFSAQQASAMMAWQSQLIDVGGYEVVQSATPQKQGVALDDALIILFFLMIPVVIFSDILLAFREHKKLIPIYSHSSFLKHALLKKIKI